jgi:uncharacterized protein YbjT (DUF2867 family)
VADVLVTGGTGNLGRVLVPRLLTKGYGVRVLSRRERPAVPAGARAVRGDLGTGEGIEDALTGADVIVHCASGTGTARGLMYRSARKTDVEATRRLLDIGAAKGSPHVVYISIVGVDKIPLGYYRAKHETEQVISSSGLPFTILRTTQWHTLAWEFCERLVRLPIVGVPAGLKLQLLDPGEVADRMVSLVEGVPAGAVADMGGPAVLDIRVVARSYLRATGKRRPVFSLPLPGRTIAAFRAGHNWTPEHADGRVTWDDWLAARTSG